MVIARHKTSCSDLEISQNQRIPLAGLAKGAYCVRVADDNNSRIKTLIIH